MTSTCFTSLQLCGIRVAKLTPAGFPDTGAGNGYISDASVKLGVNVTLAAASDFEQKNGCGQIMAAFKQPDRIKRLDLSLELCQLDAELISMLTSSDVFSSAGNAIGMQLPPVSGVDPSPVCLEGWSKAWDGDQQAVVPFTTPKAAWIHWVFPFTQWTLGQFTLEDALQVIPVNGTGTENENITADGPFDDWPLPVANAGGVTRVGGWFIDDTLPTTACEPIEVPSQAS